MKSCKVIQELVCRIRLMVWAVSQIIRRVDAAFTATQRSPLRLHVNFQLQLYSLPNRQWQQRNTNYGIHTAQYLVINFLRLLLLLVTGDSCDVIIILHPATHFEACRTPSLAGMLVHRYTMCTRTAAVVVYTEDCRSLCPAPYFVHRISDFCNGPESSTRRIPG